MSEKTYLGDGVYAMNDGFHIVLTTDGNEIFLEDAVFYNLLDFAKSIGWMKEDDE